MTAVARQRGRTSRGRGRANRQVELAKVTGRPLLRGVDHGPPIVVRSEDVGAGKRSDRWIDPFLEANRPQLRRLELRPEVAYDGEIVLRLHPGNRIGAVPLFAAATRKVAAGVLVQPRFHWSALADVVGRIGFEVEPQVGGGRMVPGSARDVPAWLLAAPVLRRLGALLRRRKRAFVVQEETRTAPRGRVDWSRYAQRSIPSGLWHHLPCRFSVPEDDPHLLATVRWTLDRVAESLASLAPTPIGRALLGTTAELLVAAGAGPRSRPSASLPGGLGSEIVVEALQAMGWVADERGLGGARTLDGLPWDLAVDTLWESWVAHVMRQVGPRTGFAVRSGEQTRHRLQWRGPVQSMRSLVPDVELIAAERVVWIDAKYKSHLMLLARSGWLNQAQDVRDAHRADLHQALAYAALGNVASVDTVLVYPQSPDQDAPPAASIATIASGTRRVRLLLAGLPFGFRSRSHEERVLEEWRGLLRDQS